MQAQEQTRERQKSGPPRRETCLRCESRPITTERRAKSGRRIYLCDSCYVRQYSRPCSQCGTMLTAETVNRDYRGYATGACQGRCEKDRLAIAQRASRIRRGRTAPEGPVRRPARYDAICLDCSCSAYQGFRGATCLHCECPEDQHIEITAEVEE